ncbi:malectin domain-containing carbohydrate-binding protein, partial [Myxococcota bacterium]
MLTRAFAIGFLISVPFPGWALDGSVLITTGEKDQMADVAIIDVNTGMRTVITSGGSAFGPCFSPDGTQIAFWRGGEILTMELNGSNVTKVGDTFAADFRTQTMSWTHSDYIYWSEESPYVYRIEMDGGNASREVVHTSDEPLHAVSVSLDGTRAACTKVALPRPWHALGIDLVTHAEVDFGPGCQGTISPDGTLATHNLNHSQAAIHNFSDGSVDATIDVASGRDLQMIRFSHSSNDWIVYTADQDYAYVCDFDDNVSYFVGRGAAWDYRPTPPVVPELTSVDLSSATDTLLPGESVVLTAALFDQNGQPFAAPLSWAVTGGGIVSPAATPSATDHTATFTSDGQAGSFVVTAESGGVRDILEVTVVSVAIPLRINCGSNDHDVSGWLRDDPFVTGGSDWTNPNPVSINGVADAAPDEVYRTVRHGLTHTLTIPVPDGSYAVRLHFADAHDNRSMTYTIEGTIVLESFDPVTAAGGTNRAYVETFTVLVDDGDGIQIVAESSDDALEAGVEVLDPSAVNQGPLVDAGSDLVTDAGSALLLDATVEDDGLPSGTLTVAWTVTSGPDAVQIDAEDQEDTLAFFPTAGDYVLQLSASDGALQAVDEIAVSVVDVGQPVIKILSPRPGDALVVGSMHVLEWTTANLDDVAIRY